MALFNYECDEIKRIIEEVSPNYPQLTTYTSEWLYFYENEYTPGTPVELEYQVVKVNPSGSVLNAIPYPYKSAILSGNTLVNLLNSSNIVNTDYAYKINDVITVISRDNSPWSNWTIPINNATQNSTYIMCWDNLTYTHTDQRGTNQLIGVYGFDDSNTQITIKATQLKQTTNYLIFTIPSTVVSKVSVRIHASTFTGQQGATTTIKGLKFIEYQDGMENWDIPYFEGMQSVKMPVLTTSNEDGTKSKILTVNEEVELGSVGDIKDELDLLTGEVTRRIGEVVFNGTEDWTRSANATNSPMFYTSFNNLVRKGDYLNSISCDKLMVYANEYSLLQYSTSLNGISAYNDYNNTYPNENWFYIKYTDSEGSVEKLKQWLSQNPVTVQYELATESVETVDLTSLNKPYEGVNNYYISANIPCEAVLEVPVVSIGKQTLKEINN